MKHSARWNSATQLIISRMGAHVKMDWSSLKLWVFWLLFSLSRCSACLNEYSWKVILMLLLVPVLSVCSRLKFFFHLVGSVMSHQLLMLLIIWGTLILSADCLLTLKVLNFWKFTSYCSLKPLWSGMGKVVLARTSPTLHPPSPPTVHQLSRLAL